MSSIHTDDHESPLAKEFHRIFHEIEERLDLDIETVADVIELWEEAKTRLGVIRTDEVGLS